MNYSFREIAIPFLLLLFFSACNTASDQVPSKFTSDDEPEEWNAALLEYQDQIGPEYMRPRLSAFAHDSMEGRETGTNGLEKAAEYLARQYREMGLRPVGDDGSYFQHFTLTSTRPDSMIYTVSDTSGSRILDRSVSSADSRGRFVRVFGEGASLEGEIVFAGFGVNDSVRGVSHLEGVDLRDKWVLAYQNIPGIVEGDTIIAPSINSRSRFASVVDERGALGLLLIPDMKPGEFEERATQEQESYGEPGGMRLAYRDQEEGGAGGAGYNLVHPELAARILGLQGGSEALAEHRKNLVGSLTGFQPSATGYELAQRYYAGEVITDTKNVAAFLEGGDPEVSDEVVVLTSHYDHVGIGRPDSTGDRIYNGADDDGSGTIGLLNAARAFADAAADSIRPRRSILFLNVSAEEKGLLGSRYYSDHPLFPIEKTVANLNVDMIGRVDSRHLENNIVDYTYIIGGRIISSDLERLLSEANERSGQVQLEDRYNDLEDPNQFYRRSDHWNFGRLGVPFAFFFTGVHEDYHRPSDEVEKIRFGKLSRIVRTIYATAVLTANTDDPPRVDNQEFIEITQSNSR